MKYTIINFNSHSHSNNGIIDVSTYELEEEVFSRPDLDEQIEDINPISQDSWEVEFEDFACEKELIAEVEDRASYSDIVLAEKENIYTNR